MSERGPTFLGTVRQVLGSSVTVDLDPALAGVAPIYEGRLQRVGMVGSLVLLPEGLIDVVATVSLVGIREEMSPDDPSGPDPAQRQWLEVELIGEIDRATGSFERGVGSYPSVGDEVHFATPRELREVFPPPGDHHVRIGWLSAAPDVPICVDASKLVVRHSAVIGSTGSGKTSAVASILQGLVEGGWQSGNVIVIDPHGEYVAALASHAEVRSVLGNAEPQRLRVPYWALPGELALSAFLGSHPRGAFRDRALELIADERRRFAATADWITADASAITVDTPIPYDMHDIWYQLDRENGETRERKGDPTTACLIEEGDPARLESATFKPYNPAGSAPHRSPLYDAYGTAPDRLRIGLRDPRLRFLQLPNQVLSGDPLVAVVKEWLGHSKPISVLDFSGVPRSAAELAVGVVLDLLFELASHARYGEPGIGRPNPILVVLEEAHRYLGGDTPALTSASANRIAREGRKYGVGMMLVTQRPTELPSTALSQCGTIIALRLSTSDDQSAVRSALPDTVSGLAAALSSLRTHEAVVSGESLTLPVRALLELPSPWPEAKDPDLTPWRKTPSEPEIVELVRRWRETYGGGTDD